MKITKNALINDTIEKHPEVAEVLMGYGLNCVGCIFSNEDTIGAGAKIHGLNDETIDMIIKDVNTVIKNDN